jgi:L-2-hydroxycarboxylate dehydrogenase (NAD+)
MASLSSSTGASVTPFGGAQMLLGTNPLSISAPSASDEPLGLDTATIRIACGKVVAALSKQPISEGRAVDSSRYPTTVPQRHLRGRSFRWEHEGAGSAVLVEAMSVILGGGFATAIACP